MRLLSLLGVAKGWGQQSGLRMIMDSHDQFLGCIMLLLLQV